MRDKLIFNESIILGKQIHCILEGVDGVGKTSTAKVLSNYGWKLTHYPYSPNLRDLKEFYSAQILKLTSPEIWDRSFISEYVYGRVLREKSRLSLDDILNLSSLFKEQNGKIIILSARNQSLISRFSKSGRVNEYDALKSELLQNEYSRLGQILIDKGFAELTVTSDLSQFEVCKTLINRLSK